MKIPLHTLNTASKTAYDDVGIFLVVAFLFEGSCSLMFYINQCKGEGWQFSLFTRFILRGHSPPTLVRIWVSRWRECPEVAWVLDTDTSTLSALSSWMHFGLLVIAAQEEISKCWQDWILCSLKYTPQVVTAPFSPVAVVSLFKLQKLYKKYVSKPSSGYCSCLLSICNYW